MTSNTFYRRYAEGIAKQLKSVMLFHNEEITDLQVESFKDLKEDMQEVFGVEKINVLIQNIELLKQVESLIKNNERCDFDLLQYYIDELEMFADFTQEDYENYYLKEMESQAKNEW